MLYISSNRAALIVHFNLPSVFQSQEENATDRSLHVRLPWKELCRWINILYI